MRLKLTVFILHRQKMSYCLKHGKWAMFYYSIRRDVTHLHNPN